MLPLLALLVLAASPQLEPLPTPPPPPPPRAHCIDSQGRTVCGFKCTTSATSVDCAQTPYGTCLVLAGKVHCWDPPRVAIHHPPSYSVTPECKEIRGKVACGFNCRVFNGEVACTNTPYGVCVTHFSRLVCWDPPDSVIHEYGSSTPRPRCLNASDAVACGFDCKALRTDVRCAATPRGVCKHSNDQLTCFDPPSLLHCDHSEPPAPPR